MNWKQLYTASTPAEREEILIAMLRSIEARQQQIILARGRLVRNRRRAMRLHFINERRMPSTKRFTLNLVRTLFIFIAVTISITTWLIAANIQPIYGAPLLFGYTLILLAILLIKPYNRQKLIANI